MQKLEYTLDYSMLGSSYNTLKNYKRNLHQDLQP